MEKNVEKLLRGDQFIILLNQTATDIRENYDLKNIDIEILYYLSRNLEYNTARDIRKFLKINKGYLSQVLDALCRKNYLTATPDREDRRYVHYILSDESACIIDKIQTIREEIEKRIFKGISKEEQDAFRKTASKIEQNILEMLNQ